MILLGSDLLIEILYQIRNEKVITLNDVMLRRTQIQLTENQGLDCVENIAQFMGRYMNWNSKKIADEIKIYLESLVLKPKT